MIDFVFMGQVHAFTTDVILELGCLVVFSHEGRSISARAATPETDFRYLSMSADWVSVPSYCLSLSRRGDVAVLWTAARTRLKL